MNLLNRGGFRTSTRLIIVIIISILFVKCSTAQTSSLVSLGAGGKLEYKTFANTGQTNSVNIIPDFSYAGYKGGGVTLPVAPVAETVQPVSGDAKALIQSAINRVSALPLNVNGFRGAVLLKSGRYEVNGSLFIKANGVVLRGEGQNSPDKGGTELVATSPTQHDFIQIQGNESSSEPANESALDTKLYPAVRTWQEFTVTKGLAEELDGDKIVSFHLTADINQYVNYASREDSVKNRPVLEITVRSQTSGVDSIITLLPVADTYVMGGTNAKNNYGADSSVAVKNAGVNANVTREAYLKFILPQLQDSIKKAVLKLYAKKDLDGDPAAAKVVYVSVSSIKNDFWQEMTLTYETRPLSAGLTGAVRISSPYVATGAASFTVDSVTGFSVGDTIRITRTPNEAWITTLDMAQYGWVAAEYRVSYERIITGITGKTISVNIPLVQAIETGFGGGEISRISINGRITNCGIEKMFITSIFASDIDESHGWSAITISQSTDCWVKNVTARYFGYSCVGLYWAYNTTVEECAMLDPKSITTGSRKYSFYIDKGSFNLFQRCYTRGGRHDYVTGSRVTGPNVFVDCFSTQTYADIGPHHRYATGILFDNIQGGETRVQNRKDMGTGHGWAGAQTMFWNAISNTGELKVESPIGAMNWGIGCKGVLQLGAGFWESYGTPVMPRSLYLQQLKDRAGTSAVENVTLPAQRTGSIWTYLSAWAGIGELSALTKTPSEKQNQPFQFFLSQNYPNPFNPSTALQFTVPVNGRAILTVYNAIGQQVATLYNDEAEGGKNYQVIFNAPALASGLYIARLEQQNSLQIKKMVLIR